MTEQCKRSFKAREALEKAEQCGCYYCTRIYTPGFIKEWEDNDKTAICPICGIDSVVPYDVSLDESLDKFKQKLEKWYKESFGHG